MLLFNAITKKHLCYYITPFQGKSFENSILYNWFPLKKRVFYFVHLKHYSMGSIAKGFHATEKVKNPSTGSSYFHHFAHNWQVKCWVLCHTFQEHSGVLKWYTCDWNLKKDEHRKSLRKFSQVINFTTLYSLLARGS